MNFLLILVSILFLFHPVSSINYYYFRLYNVSCDDSGCDQRWVQTNCGVPPVVVKSYTEDSVYVFEVPPHSNIYSVQYPGSDGVGNFAWPAECKAWIYKPNEECPYKTGDKKELYIYTETYAGDPTQVKGSGDNVIFYGARNGGPGYVLSDTQCTIEGDTYKYKNYLLRKNKRRKHRTIARRGGRRLLTIDTQTITLTKTFLG